MAAPGGYGDGAGAGHGDHALVLDALGVVQLLAVDAALALRDESVDRLVAVHAFVVFREPRAFSKPETEVLLSNLGYVRRI